MIPTSARAASRPAPRLCPNAPSRVTVDTPRPRIRDRVRGRDPAPPAASPWQAVAVIVIVLVIDEAAAGPHSPTISASFRTVFQLRAVVGTPRHRSACAASLERPIPSGACR